MLTIWWEIVYNFIIFTILCETKGEKNYLLMQATIIINRLKLVHNDSQALLDSIHPLSFHKSWFLFFLSATESCLFLTSILILSTTPITYYIFKDIS